jgi:hypothetical protein
LDLPGGGADGFECVPEGMQPRIVRLLELELRSIRIGSGVCSRLSTGLGVNNRGASGVKIAENWTYQMASVKEKDMKPITIDAMLTEGRGAMAFCATLTTWASMRGDPERGGGEGRGK